MKTLLVLILAFPLLLTGCSQEEHDVDGIEREQEDLPVGDLDDPGSHKLP